MTISRLRTPLLLVTGFVVAFGAALWALAATGGTDPARGATDDAEVSSDEKEADCTERKEQMLDKMVEAGKLTEEQKVTVLSLMGQLREGDITKEEFKDSLEEEGIDLPKPKFRGHKGGHMGMGQLSPEEMAEKKAQMLDKMVEAGKLTEEQRATIEDLTKQLMDGDITKEEFGAALEDAGIDLPKHGPKAGYRGHGGFGGPGMHGGADKDGASADETVNTSAI